MPIKLKCNCGQVLSVPDNLAGKSGNCPKCKKTIKIPIPKAKGAGSRQPQAVGAKSAARTQAAPAKADLDSLFEEAGLTVQKGPVCSNCGSSIKPGMILCTVCGFHFETGENLSGYKAKAEDRPEFDNLHLQEAANNMTRELIMEDRREKAAMPWWVLMSFLIGAMTLSLAGVIIVDGFIGTPSPENSFIGKVQRWPVFVTLGLTVLITGLAITIFAHLSICAYAFSKSFGQGFACLFLPLLFSFIYGILNWTNNKAPIKAIMMALAFIGFGVFLIISGGGFTPVVNAFR